MKDTADGSASVRRALLNLCFALNGEADVLRKEASGSKADALGKIYDACMARLRTTLKASKDEDVETCAIRVMAELRIARAEAGEGPIKANLTKSLAAAIEEKGKALAELTAAKAQFAKAQAEDDAMFDRSAVALGRDIHERLDQAAVRVARDRDAAQLSLIAISAENSGLKLRIDELEKLAKPGIAAKIGDARDGVVKSANIAWDYWNEGKQSQLDGAMRALRVALYQLANQ